MKDEEDIKDYRLSVCGGSGGACKRISDTDLASVSAELQIHSDLLKLHDRSPEETRTN